MLNLVDVNIAVYNHAPFLKQTLDGVLNQKTNFQFRILVGDDCSTDGSIDILREYEANFPEKIQVIYQPVNLGLKSELRNGVILLLTSTAKYIALLDGDDYWIDPLKLQKQIDFLEANKEYSGHCHNAWVLKGDNYLRKYSNYTFAKEFHSQELLTSLDIPTSSVVFKNIFLNGFPPFLKNFILDITIYYAVSLNGRFYMSSEIMSVYRSHDGGAWTGQDDFVKVEKAIEINRKLIEFLPLNLIELRAVKASILGLKQQRIKIYANRFQFGLIYFSDVFQVAFAKLSGYDIKIKYFLYCIFPNSLISKIQNLRGALARSASV